MRYENNGKQNFGSVILTTRYRYATGNDRYREILWPKHDLDLTDDVNGKRDSFIRITM